MSHHITAMDDVCFTYPDGNEVLSGVSFIIHHGESVGIIGANGAGKSTMLMLLLGVLFSTKGVVRVGDTPVNKKTLPSIRERVGMVFQNTDDQLFMTTVYDDVAFGPQNARLDDEEVDRRVMQALEKVGIAHLKDRPPFKLSEGEKRAAAIASVLSMQPDILVMDEPTSSLDPKSRRRLMTLLKEFSHTKIITSHDLDMVYEVCTRTIVINNGRIAADGPTHAILTDEALMERCGLETPASIRNCPVCGHAKNA
jgi:cobalt/nickel transport system ATP-binding protein